VFDEPYDRIAEIVGTSEQNARQLAARARRHVDERRPRLHSSREEREQLATHFFAAAEQGDLQGLEQLPAHDVQLTGDGGGKVPALARSLYGRNRVAPTLIKAFRRPGVSLRPVVVNGGPGAVFLDAQQRLIAVMALGTAGGQITSISSIVNPDKLAHLGRSPTSARYWGRRDESGVVAASPRAAVKDSARLPVRAAYAALAWVVVFFAFHVYWFLGGSFGLSGELPSLVPDSVAGWIYEVLEGTVGPLGAWVCLAIARGWPRGRMRRAALIVVWLGCAVLVSSAAPGSSMT
jgi:hypothetical protein